MSQKIEVLSPSYQSLFIEMLFNEQILSSGTAFVVAFKNDYFLITNWHNVTGRSPTTKNPLSEDAAIPNRIRIYFNKKNNLGLWVQEEISLYKDKDDEQSYIWMQHPKFKEKVDVVAIKIARNEQIDFHAYQLPLTFVSKIYPSDSLSVVGFPFGKTSFRYLAIWVTGTLATDLDVDYGGLPCFLLDCRSRQGQSGSPVIEHGNPGHTSFNGKKIQMHAGFRTVLYGVYSGRINENSDLGYVWKTSAIQEILEQK